MISAAKNYVVRGDKELLREWLLQNPTIVDEVDDTGENLLLAAIRSSQLRHDIVQLLLENGANPNLTITHQRSPLEGRDVEMLTAVLGEEEVEKLQASNVPKPNVSLTLLPREAIQRCDLELIQLLVAKGADFGYVTKEYATAAYDCTYNSQHGLAILKHLTTLGIPINEAPTKGQAPVLAAYIRNELEMLRVLLEAGADPKPLRWTAVHKAIVFGSIHEIEAAINEDKLSQQKDRLGHLPIHTAAKMGNWKAFDLLVKRGADPDAMTKSGLSALDIALQSNQIQFAENLIAEPQSQEMLDSALRSAVKSGDSNQIELLLSRGANPNQPTVYGSPLIDLLSDPEQVQLFMKYGASLDGIGDETKRLILGLPILDGLTLLNVSESDYFASRYRRVGNANPQDLTDPYKIEMIRSGANAFNARSQFKDEAKFTGVPNGRRSAAAWCFDRFGQSITFLPDGRKVLIAGEHEDWYDNDFCIYNDVTVFEPNGEIRVYGYPYDVFPPTDFHSATLVGDWIYIIGCVGYMGERAGLVPVYRLSTVDYHIERVQTSGDIPGRISRHRAQLIDGAKIRIEGGKVLIQQAGGDSITPNEDTFELDLTTLKWSKITP